MISKWRLFLKDSLQKLWVVALLYAVLALVTNLAATMIGPLLPQGLGGLLGAGAVEAVLTILASSMLTVVTFSLGIMVSSLTGAAAAVTPRAIALLKADRTTQRVLATFLGSFLYSLIGIVALKAGVLTDNDRLVLFAVTIAVILIVVAAILRWIDHLTVFGLMTDSIDKVETATERAIAERISAPYLGGHRHAGPPPPAAHAVYPATIGYIRYIHMQALQNCAADMDCQIYLNALPGSFVHPGCPLLHLLGDLPDHSRHILNAFTITDTRSFDQDPRFGLSVMAEIAERALSPAVNDPGTAIDVLGRAVRLLAPLAEPRAASLSFSRLWVPPIALADMFDDVFPPVARDGAGLFAVQMRLQKALLALSQINPVFFGKTAYVQLQQALARCTPQLMAHEIDAITTICAQIADTAGPHPTPKSI
jgi:uncharacterized membrane protein